MLNKSVENFTKFAYEMENNCVPCHIVLTCEVNIPKSRMDKLISNLFDSNVFTRKTSYNAYNLMFLEELTEKGYVFCWVKDKRNGKLYDCFDGLTDDEFFNSVNYFEIIRPDEEMEDVESSYPLKRCALKLDFKNMNVLEYQSTKTNKGLYGCLKFKSDVVFFKPDIAELVNNNPVCFKLYFAPFDAKLKDFISDCEYIIKSKNQKQNKKHYFHT